MTEQTLRERLAEAMYRANVSEVIAGPFSEQTRPMRDTYQGNADAALSVFREWLETEAPEILRKSAGEWSTNVAPGKLPYWKHLSRALAQSLGGQND